MADKLAALAVAAVVVLAIVISVPLAFQAWNNATGSSTTSSSSTNSTSTTTTTVSTTSTVTTTVNTTSSTITVSSTSTSQTNTSADSFTYSPTYPVEVQSVRAIVSTVSNGDRHVFFQVTFQNAGYTPIHVAGGCGSGLSATIPGDSSVLEKVPGGPLCACAMFIQSMGHGQNHTSSDPGCWSGYGVKLVHSGSAVVNLTLSWSVGSGLQNENSTTITANFTFS